MQEADKRLAIALWWAPFYVLFAESYSDMASPVKRHARWAVAYLLLFLLTAVVVIAIFTTTLNAGGAAILLIVLVAVTIPALNTLAVWNNRGPFFSKASDS